IQAFEPVLIEGRAIKLHPLVCTAFNADFDGDQMAVHLPLTPEAQAEARYLMLSANNLLKPQDGKPVAVPTQDMILGAYYLTIEEDGVKGEGMIFKDKDEAMMAYQDGVISIHAKIKVRMFKEIDGEMKSKIIDTTIGKIIYNEVIPQDLGFVDRSNPENAFDLEVNFPVTKKTVKGIVSNCIKVHGISRSAELLDDIKSLGYKYSTKGAITVAISDVIIPAEKKEILAASEEKVDQITKQYKRGLISNEERYNSVIKVWDKATNDITDKMIANFDDKNPIYMMATSGARGDMKQIRQLAGMRGLMADTAGRTVEIPIRSCFREGMDVLEYFVSAHGARKGLVDTALRTADSGYLTRRLVDVSQEIIVREEDCGTDDGMWVTDIKNGNELIEGLEERLAGRYAADDIKNPETGEVIVAKNELISDKMAKQVIKAGVTKARVRTLLTCKAKHGICAKCYGNDLASRQTVNIGEAVGIIAAQSIGEPGTQLTMRTFHMGGLAGGDITQGLPRVEELFEARKPKGLAIVSDIAGKVTISDTRKKREAIITNDKESRTYLIPFGSRLCVHDGDEIEACDAITEGSIYPQDIMRIKGAEGVQSYIVTEVQKVYRSQGVDINDRHIEAIIRQMLRKVKVEDCGDTNMLPGTMTDITIFEEENKKAVEAGLRPAEGKRVLLGITKAALATDSFLSAASFQETTRVLTEASIKGKIDPLIGLKENVIIGKLIPAGTGLMHYREYQPYSAETGEPTSTTVPEPVAETEEA
ncbi:MAG: DNA-directed RNA polymerase subunit beta', partial [Clostridia bacterium]|nr:DNA-directed RNA polymerase subunit beta' [Clostridia bacterium]